MRCGLASSCAALLRASPIPGTGNDTQRPEFFMFLSCSKFAHPPSSARKVSSPRFLALV